MKIVHMSLGNERGGSTGVMLQLAHGAARRGYDVTVMVFRDGVVRERAEALGLTVKLAGGGRASSVMRMYRLLKSHRPSIVHTHSYFPDVFGRPAARMAGVPVVVTTAHTNLRGAAGLSGRGLPGRKTIVPMLSRWTNNSSDRFYATSSDVSQFLKNEGVCPAKIRLLLNEIDTAPFTQNEQPDRNRLRRELGYGHDDIVLGAAGRLEDVKRFDLLVESLARLAVNIPQLKVLLIGEGSARTHLEGLIQSLGMDGRVQLAGWRNDVARLLSAIDIYAVVSRMEGTPLSLLEAMAAGCSCVAVDVGGLPDLIVDESLGRIVPQENPQALDSVITELAVNPSLRKALGEKARSHVFTHHNTELEKNLNTVLADYECLLESKGNHK